MARRRSWGAILVATLAGSVAGRASGQFDSAGQRANTAYLDVSIEAATHLRTAASYVADNNWPEAIDLLQKLIERFGDKVVQVGTSSIYLSVRDYCHRELCRMPPEARALYRVRVDALAESWFREGLRTRDRELLNRVVEQLFASSWGDDALDALAELAFEAGQFDEALLLWQRIDTGDALDRAAGGAVDDVARAPRNLVYPDTDLNFARLDAKQILCQVFRGQRELAQQRIAAFRRVHATARGTIGGVEGPLADRLAAILQNSKFDATADDGLWTTFAGNPQRTKVAPFSVDIGSVQWEADLPQVAPRGFSVGSRPMSNNADDVLSYHPLVLRDWVVVCGREDVRVYDLHEGPKNKEPLWTFRLRDTQGQPFAGRAVTGWPHYTMTADRGRLYVRLGAPETTVARRAGGQPDSYLVCLDLMAEAKEIWRIQPDEPDLAFEGSPVVADGDVYVGVTRGGAMTHAFVACYDAATGAKKWRQLICESSSANAFYSQGTISHNLPTIGAGMVFYNTNLGAVAALDQRTGRVRWIVTYPRDSREEIAANNRVGAGRDLAPCIYHEGLVLAMPTDGSGVYAFDALTGELRWQSPETVKLSHLLGVAHGNLIASGSQVLAIEIATGRLKWQWSDGPGMTGYGRGVLAGEFVYFPTKTHIYMIDQQTGVLARRNDEGALQQRFALAPGNLVVAEGYLVVAQAKGLTVFCRYDVLVNRYRDLIAQDPQSADPHFGLARAAEANGDFTLAVQHYQTALELVARAGPHADPTIKQVARSQLFSLLKRLGDAAAEARNWPEVDRLYGDAARIAPTSQGRLDALLRLADLWHDALDAAKSLAIYQQLLSDESLRGLTVQVEGSRSVRSDVEIASRVEGLLDRFGRRIYARFETEAEQLFAAAQQSGAPADVERLVRAYPNAKIVATALAFAAAQHAADKQYAASAAAYRQLLARPDTPPHLQLAAVHGLAQAYESQQAWQAARIWWQRLAADFPDSAMITRPEQSVASFVAERLSRPPFDQVVSPDAERLELPLSRRWGRTWREASRVIVPQGSHGPDGSLRLLVSAGDSVECVAARSGESLWNMKLLGPVRWAALDEDHLLVGTDAQLARVDAATGELLWQQKTSSGLPGFSEFRLVDDRIFFREESRKLYCVSAATGVVHWSYTPTEGTILPNTFFSSHHVALRTRQPDKFVVLDGDGRLRFDVTQAGESWDRPPVPFDSNRVCIAADSRAVQLLDLNDGRPVWSYVTQSSDLKPVPIVGPGYVLVLVGGSTLIRLDPETGRPMWSSRVADDVLPRQPNVWTVDGERFYCITRELNLRAFRLKNGQLEWQQALTGPGDEWQVVAAAGYVVALPRQPHATGGLPVIFCRQTDGQLVQRLFFRPRGSETIVHLARQQAVIGSEREVWALARDER